MIRRWVVNASPAILLAKIGQTSLLEELTVELVMRNCAAVLGIPVRGTLGVVVLAKKEGRIPRATSLFEALLNAGLRIDEEILDKALRLAGER